MKIDVPFAHQSAESAVKQNSREKLTNMYAEIEVSGRRQRLLRRQRAGLVSDQVLAGEKRAIEKLGNLHYLVVGDTAYTWDGTTLTSIGTLNTAEGRCSIIVNDNDYVMISDGKTGYHWNGSTFSIISAPTDIDTLAFMSGYGIYNVPGEDQFYVTAVNDFTSINALDFATAESYSDAIIRVFADHNELWLFGEHSTEIWQLSGGVDFPFAAYTNAQMERGCLAKFSPAADDNTIYWLGEDGIVYRADGYRPQRVSTKPIERAISALTAAQKASAEGFFYTSEGNKFYTLRFPGVLTVQYNVSTGFWNHCKTYGYNDWRIIGSLGERQDYFLTDTGIASLSTEVNTDEGGLMVRSGVSPAGYANGVRIRLSGYFLDAEVGRAGLGVDPQVMLRVAREGETFGNERWRSLGPTGDYNRRATWRNLGVGRNITVELAVSADFNFAIVGAGGNVTALSS